MIKDHRTILSTLVISLPEFSRRVMESEKELAQLLEADFAGVQKQVEHLDVASFALANFFVRWGRSCVWIRVHEAYGGGQD